MAIAVRPAETAAPPRLRISGLSAGFGATSVLSDVELVVRPGELVAVAGEPGAGKTTLVRCLAGDLSPAAGEIVLDGRRLPRDQTAVDRRGVAVVWQHLELCDNLDVAGNVMLGRETRRQMFSVGRFHAAAAAVLAELGIPIRDTTQLVGSLPVGQRRLVAMATALGRHPQLLVLDEPTSALGLVETAQVEELLATLHRQGVTMLLAGRDVEQMFRLADRIVVLHQGRVIADLEPQETHPDEVTALIAGQQVDASARRQLSRLHGLADSLVSADPASSLPLILSALGSALGSDRICLHEIRGPLLVCAAALGFPPEQVGRFARLPLGAAGGPVGTAAQTEQQVVADLRAGDPWPSHGITAGSGFASSWSVPVKGGAGVSAVITVFRRQPGGPERDELDLLTLYAGYAASAVERERLLEEVTGRNRVLETIREMLETLTGPVPVTEGLTIALDSLRRGLRAGEVTLATRGADGPEVRAYAAAASADRAAISAPLRRALRDAFSGAECDGRARRFSGGLGPRIAGVLFNAPGGPTVLLAALPEPRLSDDEAALLEDASHSLRLALEREEAGLAHQRAAGLARSRELQRGFLSRLSHELRTPLTAIRGYASSLMQPDVTWDSGSQRRFLGRIAAESARVGRLVDDLLDFSAIESGVMRLQRDWCDLRLVLEAAVSCLPAEDAGRVTVRCGADVPVVWADHDRLEQVFVNLLVNAFRHNPSGTEVQIGARLGDVPGQVEVTLADDGVGFPAAHAAQPFDSERRVRTAKAGAGIGPSIAHGIVTAHGGTIALLPAARGTTFRIVLPIEAEAPRAESADDGRGVPAAQGSRARSDG